MRIKIILVLTTVLITVFGILIITNSSPSQNWSKVTKVPSSAGSSQPYFHVDKNKNLWMSWIESVDSTRHALKYSSFNGSSWSTPQVIVTSEDLISRGPDIPTFKTFPDDKKAVQYLVSNSSHWSAYDVNISQTNKNDNWQNPVIPHGDNTKTQHGFASILPWNNNQLLVTWLDGRNTKLEQGITDESKWGEIALYSTIIDSKGNVGNEVLLDERVCDCCSTAAVKTKNGALIAYRDRSETEIRDISLVRFDGKNWSKPYKANEDHWKIKACPVNGPALAAKDNIVVLGWYTKDGDDTLIKISFSDDGGKTFGNPILIDRGNPKGQIDLSMLDDGSALVSWKGIDNRRITIKARHIQSDGTLGEVVNIEKPSSTAFTGRPQLATIGENVVINWVDVLGNPDSTLIHIAHHKLTDFK